MFGAMSLGADDLKTIELDVFKAQDLIRQGFRDIHDMASRGGPNMARTEQFLQRLMRLMLATKVSVSCEMVSASCHHSNDCRLQKIAPQTDVVNASSSEKRPDNSRSVPFQDGNMEAVFDSSDVQASQSTAFAAGDLSQEMNGIQPDLVHFPSNYEDVIPAWTGLQGMDSHINLSSTDQFSADTLLHGLFDASMTFEGFC